MTIRFCFLIILVFGLSALATVGDFDGSGTVDVNDLTILAVDWLSSSPTVPDTDIDASGTVDLLDFAAFAFNWLGGYVNQPPTAADVTVSCLPGGAATVTLAGSDSVRETLTYTLISQPSQGLLVPQTDGVYTYYAHQTASGNDVFEYQASDGEYDSNVADVNVVFTDVTLDTIAFEARSSVVVDHASINVDSSFTLAFWFRTLWPEAALFTKWGGGAGVMIDLEDGSLAARLDDGAGNRYLLTTGVRVNNGQWTLVCLSYNSAGGIDYNGDPDVTAVLYMQQKDAAGVSTGNDAQINAIVPALDFTNDANAVFGSARSRMFYGAIDNFANYNTALSTFEMAVVSIEGRQGSANALSPSYYRRYLIDEGTGLTTKDTTATYDATMTNHGRTVWREAAAPLNHRHDDRQRLRAVDGAEMLTEKRRRH